MGQYHIIVNHTKREYLHPHRLGDGLKLLEFGSSGCGTMTALAILLAGDNGRGGGDLFVEVKGEQYPQPGQVKHPCVGSWSGDSIAIVGDYGDADDDGNVPYDQVEESYRDVSAEAAAAMRENAYIAQNARKQWGA